MKNQISTPALSLPAFTFLWTILCLGCGTAQPDSSTLLYSIEGKESAYPRLSADSKKILYQSNVHGNWQLYIMDREAGTQTRILTSTANDNFPDWSHYNQWIAFTSDRDGNEEIYLMRLDGTELKRITNDPGRDIHPYFSPDGRYLLFNSTRGNESFDVFRYTISTGELKQLTDTPENETCARFSPDMRHIVYLQNDDTKDDVMMADSLLRNTVNISNDPQVMNGWPMFSPDSESIYYSSMESGAYCIYRIKTDRSAKSKITQAKSNEEDARVCVSKDGKSIIYNKRKGGTIEIRELKL
jgi:TolB protein